MSRRATSRKGGRSKSRVPDKLDLLHQDMKELAIMQRSQSIKPLAELPDVPRIYFKDSIYNATLSYAVSYSLSTAAPTFGALQFALSSADNYDSFTSCFDQYRVIQVNVKLQTGPPSVASSSNFIYTVLDYDDANTMSSASAYLGYKTLKTTPLGTFDERTLTPRVAMSAYQSTSFSGYANMGRVWIDSASPNVNYYGLKWYSYQGNMANNLNFVVTLMVQFKSQRSAS